MPPHSTRGRMVRAESPRRSSYNRVVIPDTRPAETADHSAAVTIIHESAGCVIAAWHDISICIWGRSATLPLILELENLRKHIAIRYPRTSSIHVLVNDAGLPDLDARKKLEEVTATSEERLIAVATVVTGSGFRVSTLRGFLTSMHWLQRRTYSARVCGSIREAADWLAPLHSASSRAVEPGALESVMLRLCERPGVAGSA